MTRRVDGVLAAGCGDGVWWSSGRAVGSRLRRRHGHGRGRELNGRGARPRDQPQAVGSAVERLDGKRSRGRAARRRRRAVARERRRADKHTEKKERRRKTHAQISSGRSCVLTTLGPCSWSSTLQMSVPGSAASMAARHASTLSGSFFRSSLIFLRSITEASGRNNVFSSSSNIALNLPGGQDWRPSSENI